MYFLRLRSIEARIEHVIYRSKRSANAEVIESLLGQLAEWRSTVLSAYHEVSMGSKQRSNILDLFVSPIA